MREITGDQGSMWGSSIIGFGDFSYTNTTKKDYQWFKTGFSPRIPKPDLYVMDGFEHYGLRSSPRLGKFLLESPVCISTSWMISTGMYCGS